MSLKKRFFIFAVLTAAAFAVASFFAVAAAPTSVFASADASTLSPSLEFLDSGLFSCTATSSTDKGYTLEVKALGILPIKEVEVTLLDKDSILLGGMPFGIRLESEGALVIGVSGGPAKKAGLKKGDLITALNSRTISSSEELSSALKENGQGEIALTVVRANKDITLSVTPEKDEKSGEYRIGAYVRDSAAGIGTVTFIDAKSGIFGGLGHGITDADTGLLFPIGEGSVHKANITSLVKGSVGAPGELQGSMFAAERLGAVLKNTTVGVFGTVSAESLSSATPIEIAERSEVKEGPARILTTVEGDTPQYYDIEIEKIYLSNGERTKNFLIKVTDKALLERTGGILRGMSGSPIVQNGKLVGAVTHVLVNDPQKGYGIFIENMLKEVK